MYTEYTEEKEKIRKIAGILLVVLGLTGLFLGYFHIRQNINLATTARKSKANQNQKFAESITALQFQDTDNDGLSDYEELYIYTTSPYIEDTDSDGINDKEEISAGEDPTCPKGKDCFEGSSLTSPYSETPPIQPTLPAEPPKELKQNPFENLSIENLRNMLKHAGLGEGLLGEISDEELQEMLKETLEEIQASK